MASVILAAEPTEAPPFQEVCFDDFNDEQPYPDAEQLGKILLKAPGTRADIGKTRLGRRPISQISGLFRLAADWQADSAMRLSLLKPKRFQLHVYTAERAVILRYYDEAGHAWAAYEVEPAPGKPDPKPLVLLATDNSRYLRCGTGTIALHHDDGNLLLTRGDLVLLRVPFAERPTRVYLEGSALVRGIAVFRSRGAPEPAAPLPVELRIPRPAELTWQGELPDGISLRKLGDGSVQLAGDKETKTGQTAAAVCWPGLHEFVVEVEGASVGTGIYLGDQTGKQLIRIAFFRDRSTRKTTVGPLHPGHDEIEKTYDYRKHIVPFASPHQWIRLTIGAGLLNYWTSIDGVNWSRPSPVSLDVPGTCTQLGLYCLAGKEERSIRLRSIEIRRFDAFESLMPELPKRPKQALATIGDIDAWHAQVHQTRPADVTPSIWRRACTLETLAHCPRISFGQQLLDDLLKDVLAEPGEMEARLALLRQAALLCNGSDSNDVARLTRHYQQLGQTLIWQRYPRPFTVISRAMLRAPFVSSRPVDIFPEKLLRDELLTQVILKDWQAVRTLGRQLRYWSAPQRLAARPPSWGSYAERILQWSVARAEFHLAEPGQTAPSIPAAWRHPLVEQLNKESYNTLSEFRAALRGRAYRDACQIVSTSVDSKKAGLVDDANDPDLFISLPVSVELAMRQHPELRRAMQEQFDSLGRLRLEEAMAAGNTAAVEAIASRFSGTEAAGEARFWLGSRALSGGRFEQAIAYYTSALTTVSAEKRSDLLARLRLAGAMSGRDLGQPVSGTVQIGKTRFSPQEFERLIEETRQIHRRSAAPTIAWPRNPAVSVEGLAPRQYDVRQWSRIGGTGTVTPSSIGSAEIDWGARQLSVTLTARRMTVSNQVEIASFDLQTGKCQWSQRRKPGKNDSQWGLVPMRAVVNGSRLIARRLTVDGPELACHDLGDGKVLWNVNPADYVASGPLVVGQDLLALAVRQGAGSLLSLSAARLASRSGRILHEAELAEFHDWRSGALDFRAVAVADKIVASGGGCVLCCEQRGRIRWIRRQPYVRQPAVNIVDALPWHRQRPTVPLVIGRHVYATQPGVWAVECMDLDTGRLIWRQPFAELITLVGYVADKIILETTDGFLAIACDSGKVLWHHDTADRLAGELVGEPGGLVYARFFRDPDSKTPPRVGLVWLDPTTGRFRGSSILKTPPSAYPPRFGPLVSRGNRHWMFFAPTEKIADRTILELVPPPAAE